MVVGTAVQHVIDPYTHTHIHTYTHTHIKKATFFTVPIDNETGDFTVLEAQQKCWRHNKIPNR